MKARVQSVPGAVHQSSEELAELLLHAYLVVIDHASQLIDLLCEDFPFLFTVATSYHTCDYMVCSHLQLSLEVGQILLASLQQCLVPKALLDDAHCHPKGASTAHQLPICSWQPASSLVLSSPSLKLLHKFSQAHIPSVLIFPCKSDFSMNLETSLSPSLARFLNCNV